MTFLPNTLLTRTEPTGIGGWLVLPIIGLLYNSVGLAKLFVSQATVLVRLADSPNPIDSDLLFLHAYFATKGLALAVAAALLFLLFTRRHRLVPRLMIGWFSVVLALAVFEDLYVIMLNARRVAAGLTTIRGNPPEYIGFAEFAAAIWIPYFIRSRRVRNTFKNGAQAKVDPASNS